MYELEWSNSGYYLIEFQLFSTGQLDILEYRLEKTSLSDLAKILGGISISAVKGRLNKIKTKSQDYFDKYIKVEDVIKFLHEIRAI